MKLYRPLIGRRENRHASPHLANCEARRFIAVSSTFAGYRKIVAPPMESGQGE
jgi:hypothetical protein